MLDLEPIDFGEYTEFGWFRIAYESWYDRVQAKTSSQNRCQFDNTLGSKLCTRLVGHVGPHITWHTPHIYFYYPEDAVWESARNMSFEEQYSSFYLL